MEDARKSLGDRPAPDAGRSFASVASEETLGDILARSLGEGSDAARLKLAADAQFTAALTLCAQAAPALGMDAAEVFDELTRVPDNMLGLLHSPEGWSALVDYVASSLGKPPPDYEPTVH
ncbi:MAG: hypothetical protein COW16_08775 [Sphingomonadales bacterium CG12_big_fil_rev_8_21_14_0_65_65_10]|nr:MAG: hypothetical protein COW16_08775 [Sphingomonadales bacterium CG12_big_fil_rev_8_21_14_0_65_65_10]